MGVRWPWSLLTPASRPRLITPYIRGWFQKRDAQLYVNRGIGTITFPIRIGARPEITVFELVREASLGSS
jgi:predicted MPP superfamily phosphohydrolase